MTNELFKFSFDLRVRYHEVDVQKKVFNAHYLSYLDIAWIEYLRNIGLNYGELFETKLFDTVVAKTTLEYRNPALYDDLLTIYVRVSELRNKSFSVEFAIFKDAEELLVLTGETVYVAFDPKTNATCPVPQFIRDKITNFEQGQ